MIIHIHKWLCSDFLLLLLSWLEGIHFITCNFIITYLDNLLIY